MSRIDRGPQRAGRRPTASSYHPIQFLMDPSGAETLFIVDGQPLGLLKRILCEAAVGDRGELTQRVTLEIYDRPDVNSFRDEVTDRLHELAETYPNFEIDLNVVPWTIDSSRPATEERQDEGSIGS